MTQQEKVIAALDALADLRPDPIADLHRQSDAQLAYAPHPSSVRKFNLPGGPREVPTAPLPPLKVPDDLKGELRALWILNQRALDAINGRYGHQGAMQEWQRRREAFDRDPENATPPGAQMDVFEEFRLRRQAISRRYTAEHGGRHLEAYTAAGRLLLEHVENHVMKVREAEERLAYEYGLPSPAPGDTLRSLLRLHRTFQNEVLELERLQREVERNPYSIDLAPRREILAALGIAPPTPEELAGDPPTVAPPAPSPRRPATRRASELANAS